MWMRELRRGSGRRSRQPMRLTSRRWLPTRRRRTRTAPPNQLRIHVDQINTTVGGLDQDTAEGDEHRRNPVRQPTGVQIVESTIAAALKLYLAEGY